MKRLLFIVLGFWAAVLGTASVDPVDRKEPSGMSPLHFAVQRNETDAARRLLTGGANANATNRYGVTPLWLACQNGNSELVAALLSAGADAKEKQRGGETILMRAARTGD